MPTTVPIACNLDEAEMPARGAAIATLGERMIAVDARGRRATLEFEPGAGADLAEFVRAESRCCPFFEFEQTEASDSARLLVEVPEDGEQALRGLVAGFVAGWKALV